MKWLVWVHKILAWETWVACVEILAWVTWVKKWRGLKNGMGLNVSLFNHTLEKTVSSTGYDLIVQALHLLSYLIYFVLLLSK